MREAVGWNVCAPSDLCGPRGLDDDRCFAHVASPMSCHHLPETTPRCPRSPAPPRCAPSTQGLSTGVASGSTLATGAASLYANYSLSWPRPPAMLRSEE